MTIIATSSGGAAREAPKMETLVQGLNPGDPVNKPRIKASIAAAIARQVAGSNREEIALLVEETYERILIGAAISAHVPALTAGSVRREIIANMHRRSSDRDP